jgi:hypothetical protein
MGDRARLARLPQGQKRGLLDAAARLHHHQGDLMCTAMGAQFGHAPGGIGETTMSRRLDPDVEPRLGHIDSTMVRHHGNLPCLYDGRSSDCSVVRDSGGGPWLRPGCIT